MTARFADTGRYPSTWEELLSAGTLLRWRALDLPRASAHDCGHECGDELEVDRSVDASADEAPKFLAAARWLMREFYWHRDRLPETWGELRMHWSLEKHFEGDDSARAPADTGRAWQPRGSRYSYLNESAECTIRIRSTNTLGLRNYIVEGKSARPREYPDE